MIISRQRTATDAILQQLADQQRYVLSEWRALVLLRRATLNTARDERRWDRLPLDVHDVRPALRTMRTRGDISLLPGLPGIYQVTVPFARMAALDEQEVLLETSPFTILSHFSALIFHGLTERQPNGITATAPRSLPSDVIPIDTASSDWEDIPLPPWTRRPEMILGTPVRWSSVAPSRYNGFRDYQPHGARTRVTTPERTLVDSLQTPELSGGIANVLRAWTLGATTASLDAVVDEVERYDVQILRQRTGFVLERLGLTHPVLDQWQRQSHRGSSSRLVGTEPFAPTFDDRWNLSINASTSALGDGA